eukprot:scaffold8210_cov175-Amphora_coffeaeformis.AAC.7
MWARRRRLLYHVQRWRFMQVLRTLKVIVDCWHCSSRAKKEGVEGTIVHSRCVCPDHEERRRSAF